MPFQVEVGSGFRILNIHPRVMECNRSVCFYYRVIDWSQNSISLEGQLALVLPRSMDGGIFKFSKSGYSVGYRGGSSVLFGVGGFTLGVRSHEQLIKTVGVGQRQ